MDPILTVDADELSERIVTEVAARDGIDPVELPPLFDSVDPDALEALFASTATGAERRGKIWFPYADYDITIEYGDDPVVTIE